MSKDNHDGVTGFGHRAGHIPVQADDVQKLGPASPPVISLAENRRRQDLDWHTRRWPLSSYGRATTKVSAGLSDRKINCLLPIGEELWVGTDTGFLSREQQRLSSG